MERYASDCEYAVGWSRTGVDSSDVVIYLMGRRFGSMRDSFFGQEFSLTDKELGWAKWADIPILAYRLKQPLDDDAELRRRHRIMSDSIAPAEVEPSERMTLLQQMRLTKSAGKGMLPENIEEITSGAELMRRVRRDVDAITAKIKRQIFALQAALLGLGVWFTWCLLQDLA
jgi:hypothetical protein